MTKICLWYQINTFMYTLDYIGIAVLAVGIKLFFEVRKWWSLAFESILADLFEYTEDLKMLQLLNCCKIYLHTLLRLCIWTTLLTTLQMIHTRIKIELIADPTRILQITPRSSGGTSILTPSGNRQCTALSSTKMRSLSNRLQSFIEARPKFRLYCRTVFSNILKAILLNNWFGGQLD